MTEVTNAFTESPGERAKCAERRARVLAHPDIALLLTHPPYSAPDPRFWSGYIPPAYWEESRNDSAIRAQLIAICNKVVERESNNAAPIAPPMITQKQLAKLHICLEEYGLKDHEEKLYFLWTETNRDLASSKDLHMDEASAIIDKLTQLVNLERTSNAPATETEVRDGDVQPDDHEDGRRVDDHGHENDGKGAESNKWEARDEFENVWGEGSYDIPY